MNINKLMVYIALILFSGSLEAMMMIGQDGYPFVLETSDSDFFHGKVSEQFTISGLLAHLEEMLNKKAQQEMQPHLQNVIALVSKTHAYMKTHVGPHRETLHKGTAAALLEMKKRIDQIPSLQLPNNQSTDRYKRDINSRIDKLFPYCIAKQSSL